MKNNLQPENPKSDVNQAADAGTTPEASREFRPDLTSPDSNVSYKAMKSNDSPQLNQLQISDDSLATFRLFDYDLHAVLKEEKRRNEIGRPDPYDYADKEKVQSLLGDPEALTSELLKNFDKWNTNGDGALTPAELEDAMKNGSLSPEERVAAAALRLAYKEYAHLELPGDSGDSTFITQSDLDVAGMLFDPEKKDARFEKWWQEIETAAYDKIKEPTTFTDAIMEMAGFYDYYFTAPGKFDSMINERLARISNLHNRTTDADPLIPMCTGTTNGTCIIY